MQNTGLAIVVMLISSAMYALSFVLQHKGTQEAMGGAEGEAGGMRRLIRNPTWLIGIILFGLSFLVHLVALGLGAVAVVQPLIVTELVFIPPLAALITHAHVSRKDWLAILGVCVGLAGFIMIARPTEGNRVPTTTDWVITFVGCAVLMAVLMGFGRSQKDSVRATLFGLAAGLANALLALVAKGAFTNVGADSSGWYLDPLVWLTAIVALSTVYFVALAFRVGPITSSTPAMISINPIASSLAAVWLFGEVLTITVVGGIIIAVCVAIVIYGIYFLSGSSAVHGAEDAEAALVEEA